METKSAIIGGLSAFVAVGIAFGGFAVANADNQPTPSVTITTEAPAPIQEPVVTTPAPEPTTEAPAPVVAEPVAPVAEPVPAEPVVVEPAPVYVAPEPVAPAPVAPAPVYVAPAPAPAPAGEYNRVQLEPVNGTTAYAYSTDPNAPVNAPAMPTGNGKRG